MNLLNQTGNEKDEIAIEEHISNGKRLYDKIFRDQNLTDRVKSHQPIDLEKMGCNMKTATSVLAFFMYKKWIGLNNSYARYYLICLIYGYSPAQFDLVYYQDRLDLDSGFWLLKEPVQLEDRKLAEYKHLLGVKGIPYKRYVYTMTDLYDFFLSISIARQEADIMFHNYKRICKQVLHPTLYAEVWSEGGQNRNGLVYINE